MKRKFVIGLTGGIGSGKSTALALFRKRGIPGISSDALARDCLRRGSATYQRVVRVFGKPILGVNKEVDRATLARIVFGNLKKRRALERIVHPCVIRGLKRFIARHSGLVVLDIPLLFEAHLERLVDFIVTVSCRPEQQLQRVRKRHGWSRVQITERLKAQWPLSRKAKKSDIVLDNSGSPARLSKQISQLVETLRSN